MLPDPLHPAVVHFPIVLSCILPIVAAATLWTIRRGARPARAWAVPLLLAAALSASAWVAVETGESQSERVERIVGEQRMDAHEEMAERFLVASVILLAVTAAGLSRGTLGRSARAIATVGSAALVIGAVLVGHSGGQLVYKYGAAGAYVDRGASAMGTSGDADLRVGTPARGGEDVRDP